MTWHLDPPMAAAYAAGTIAPAEVASIDAHSRRCPACRATLTDAAQRGRLDEVWIGVTATLDAPRRSVPERLALRLGLPEHVGRLMAATPALRRSWFLAILVAVFFALSASNDGTSAAEDAITLFLVLAPIVPVAGVALAFGPGVDPVHEVAVAAPIDGFRLLMLRSLAVVATALAILLPASLLLPEVGLLTFGWLIPALALTALTLAASRRWAPRRAAGVVAAAWVVLAGITSQPEASAGVLFSPGDQLLLALLGLAAAASIVRGRRAYDRLGGHG